MIRYKHLALIATLQLVVGLPAALQAADLEPTSERPSGQYQVVQLQLSEGLRFEGKNRDAQPPQTVHLIFRDETLVNWWFVDHGWEAMHQPGSNVKLTGDGIRGDLNLRIYNVGGKLQLVADLSFDVGRKVDRFDGSVEAKVVGVVQRSWKSTASGEFVKPANSFADEASWPSFAGPRGTLNASPDGPPLVDDLSKSRPLWRSEASVPVSYGNAADDRYPHRAAGCRFGGGSSSPVYADGVVYIAFYKPNMDIAPVSPGTWADKWFGESLQEYARQNSLIQEEVKAIEDHWRKVGDDVIVAMDARTGETLWRTTWPSRVYNLQTHKHRGTFGVPLVAGGRVYYPNFENGLEVMDAKTGEPLWEFPKFAGPPNRRVKPSGPPSQSPLLFGNTLVWSIGRITYGLSAATGDVLWENTNEEGYNDHSLRQVTLGDRRLAFVAGHRYYNPSNVRLIDPANGQSLWTEQVGQLRVYEGLFANTLAIAGDKLVAFQAHVPKADPKTGKINKEDVTHHIHAWRLSTSGIEHLWQDNHLPPDEGPHLAIGDGVVYGVGHHLVRCLDLETGKVRGEIIEGEFPHPEGHHGDTPRSNPLLIVAGDKLILSPEGQHGKHGFILFDADPSKLTLYGNQEKKWVPPHATTTAYGRQPIVNPIVDGRMFFRGGNGIYCYDLRAND